VRQSRPSRQDILLTYLSVTATALTILSATHEHLLTHPIAPLSHGQLAGILSAVQQLASHQVISNLETVNSNPSPISSPASTSDKDGAIRNRSEDFHTEPGAGIQSTGNDHEYRPRRISSVRPTYMYEQIAILRRFSGMDLALLVLDMQGAILSQSLAPVEPRTTYDTSYNKGDYKEEHYASNASWSTLTRISVQEVPSFTRLGESEEHCAALEVVASAAVQWWEEIMHGSGIGLGVGIARRFVDRGQSGINGGGLDYGENAVTIAILVRLVTVPIRMGSVGVNTHRLQ
jgi:hypothetical protein